MSPFFPPTGSAFTGAARCHHQDTHKPSTMVQFSIKNVCACVHAGVCALVCVCLSVCVGRGCTLHHQFEPIFDIFYGLEVSVDMAVLFGLCLWITACLLRRSAPSRGCATKMFYLLSGLASIKLMESIQLPSSFPFPFRPHPQMTIH